MVDNRVTSSLHNYVQRQRYIMGGDRLHLTTLAKNHRPFLRQLNLQKKMPVHEGCVNTLAWNQNGQYLLSGSDDCYLCVTKPNLCNLSNKDYQIKHKILSGHRANIFSAQFMPFTGDTKITSCSSNGSIIVTDTNKPESSGTNLFDCHRYTCFEVAPLPDHANVFLSCSQDKTVRLFDLRTTQSCLGSNCQKNILLRGGFSLTTISINPVNPEQFLVGRSDGRGVLFDRRKICKDSDLSYHHQQEDNDYNGQSDQNQIDQLKSRGLNHPEHGAIAKFGVPVFSDDKHTFTSLCFSPDGRQVLASYSGDYIYLFDADRSSNIRLNSCLKRQKSDTNPSKDCYQQTQSTGSNLQTRTFRVRGNWSDTGPNSRPLGISSGANDNEVEGPDLRQSFMSRLTRAASTLLIGTPRLGEGLRSVHGDPTRQVFIGASELLGPPPTMPTNESNARQSTNRSSTSVNDEAADTEFDREDLWIPSIVDGYSEDDEDTSEDDEDDDDDGDIFSPELAFNIHQQIQPHPTGPENLSNLEIPSASNEPRMTRSTGSSSNNNTNNKISQASKEKFSQSFRKAKEAVKQIPSYQPKMVYKGHRNCRTAIKEATFWGDDHIISGSDCGRIFIWDRNTSDVVMLFQGDQHVVNCIAPNPMHYCLATSGIDYDIKLWSTQFDQHEPLSMDQDEIDKIIGINEQMIQEDKRTITMPTSFVIHVLARLASRRIVDVERMGQNDANDEL